MRREVRRFLHRRVYRLEVVFLAIALCGGSIWAAQSEWGEFVEPRFPYFASSVDARGLGESPLKDNLTIRGIVLMLGHKTYACFDTELLRLSLVWQGEFMEFRSKAAISYASPGQKNSSGQKAVNRPIGTPITATGLYPGVGLGDISLNDPRSLGPDPRDLGRGPIPESMGRWEGFYVIGDAAILHYTVGGVAIHERVASFEHDGVVGYTRNFRIGPHSEELNFVLGESSETLESSDAVSSDIVAYKVMEGEATVEIKRSNVRQLRVAPNDHEHEIVIAIWRVSDLLPATASIPCVELPEVDRGGPPRWSQPVVTHGILSEDAAPYVVDALPLPESNPWQRQVRSAGLDFFRDGRGALVTFDGDVWLVSGLSEGLTQLEWKRIASGLHEPQSINIRDDELFVLTRNGIVRLHDLNGDGEIDYYENFSNGFTQSVESREFVNSCVLANDGGFYIAKGGQQGQFQGIHNACVLKVSRDGKSAKVVASGLRQPYLGYNKTLDLLTATDQQGRWVPSTPILWLREGRHYGFRPSAEVVAPDQSTTEPVCWIPHRVVQSGAGQVWVESNRMGPLNGKFLGIDYYRPRVFLGFLDDPARPLQGAVTGLDLPFDVPLLKARVHPVDGMVYLTGFKIWGSNSKSWQGLCRIRYTGAPIDFPVEVRSAKQGIWLKFDQSLDRASVENTANYSLQKWNYLRTKNYGSGYYKSDGSPGTEFVGLSGAILSVDRRSVFVVVPGLESVMQMEVVYRLRTASGTSLEGSVYLTVHELADFDFLGNGFSMEKLERLLWAPVQSRRIESGDESSLAQGETLYQTMGCMACHSMDGSTAGRSGPTFAGLYGRERTFTKGEPRVADDAYIRDSILEPTINVLKDYATSDIGMPTYQGVLTKAQIESLVLFVRSLAGEPISTIESN